MEELALNQYILMSMKKSAKDSSSEVYKYLSIFYKEKL